MDAISLSPTLFSKLSPGCQEEILNTFRSSSSHTATTPAARAQSFSDETEADEDAPVAFSEREMRKFIEGVGPKTKAFLVALAEMPARFNVGSLLKKLNVQYNDIRGIQAGLTKRSRTISGNDNAWFFRSIEWKEEINECISEIHADTHEALRRVLKKK